MLQPHCWKKWGGNGWRDVFLHLVFACQDVIADNLQCKILATACAVHPSKIDNIANNSSMSILIKYARYMHAVTECVGTAISPS